jgi:D-arabinose 1-dehydrogenase-like Zn-dependent alcohol dehydrogenase
MYSSECADVDSGIALQHGQVCVEANVRGWKAGDRAMALLAGGGYTEEVVVDHGSAMHVPDALSDIEAGRCLKSFSPRF